jgi:hypothetical protein
VRGNHTSRGEHNSGFPVGDVTNGGSPASPNSTSADGIAEKRYAFFPATTVNINGPSDQQLAQEAPAARKARRGLYDRSGAARKTTYDRELPVLFVLPYQPLVVPPPGVRQNRIMRPGAKAAAHRTSSRQIFGSRDWGAAQMFETA